MACAAGAPDTPQRHGPHRLPYQDAPEIAAGILQPHFFRAPVDRVCPQLYTGPMELQLPTELEGKLAAPASRRGVTVVAAVVLAFLSSGARSAAFHSNLMARS